MAHSKKYIERRLLELTLIAETRELEEIEKDEERALIAELKKIVDQEK